LIDDANSEPFCSSFTRLLAGVAGPKKVFQSVVIFEMALRCRRE
jgi:hypothetical protein